MMRHVLIVVKSCASISVLGRDLMPLVSCMFVIVRNADFHAFQIC